MDKNIMTYVKRFSAIFLIAVMVMTLSGCKLIQESIQKQFYNEEVSSSTDTGIIDHGTFTGVPLNTRVSSIPISGQAIDADISGNYAYVTNDLGVLYIVDIRDRERPVVTGKCRDIDSANIVIVEGNTAYVSYTEWIIEELDYYSESGFKIVDISDKENPEVIGNYITEGQWNKTVFGIFIKDNYAYLNTSDYENDIERNTLEIVDISIKENPVIVSELELDGSPANIYVEEDDAYINVNHYDYDADQYTEDSELLIVDISDSENPVLKDMVSVPDNSWGIYQQDGMVYLSSNRTLDDGYEKSMVQLVDVSGETPVLRGSMDIPGGAWELDMAGGFLYVSDLTGGIYTIDVNDPDDPFTAGRLNTSGTSYDITLMGNYGYISDGFEGLTIMSLSDESSSESYEPVKQDHENLPPQSVLDIFGDTVGEYYITGTPVILSGVNSFDPESQDLDYTWYIDDMEIVGGGVVDTIFDEPGYYNVTLDVSDGEMEDTATGYIYVADINKPVENILSHEFTVELEYIIENNTQFPLSDLECLMRVPLDYGPYQYIESMDTSVPIDDFIYDNHHNKLLKFVIDSELQPGDKTSVTAAFDISVSEFEYSSIDGDLEYEQDDPDLYYYTRDDLYIDSDNPAIIRMAEKIVGNEKSPLKKAEKLYNYVTGRLSYDYGRAEDRKYEFMSASEIMETGTGVCADYSILYTAMLRAVGVPARLAAGIPVYVILFEPEKQIDIGHAWVEIKLPGYGWVPIDITTERPFWTSNYFLDIVTERGPGYIYENTTMDKRSYYYDGFDYSWEGQGIPDVTQQLLFKVKDLSLDQIERD